MFGNLKKLLILGFIGWFVITAPAAAASTAHGIAGFLEDAAAGVTTFISAL